VRDELIHNFYMMSLSQITLTRILNVKGHHSIKKKLSPSPKKMGSPSSFWSSNQTQSSRLHVPNPPWSRAVEPQIHTPRPQQQSNTIAGIGEVLQKCIRSILAEKLAFEERTPWRSRASLDSRHREHSRGVRKAGQAA
jgi:hypothetical protein